MQASTYSADEADSSSTEHVPDDFKQFCLCGAPNWGVQSIRQLRLLCSTLDAVFLGPACSLRSTLKVVALHTVLATLATMMHCTKGFGSSYIS